MIFLVPARRARINQKRGFPVKFISASYLHSSVGEGSLLKAILHQQKNIGKDEEE
jgi:hypothetical protein